MHTIQLIVNDNHLNTILNLLGNLKNDLIKDLKVIKEKDDLSDRQKKLDQVKGILKGKIQDPVKYQKALRDEWEREVV